MGVNHPYNRWTANREALFGVALFSVVLVVYSLTWFQGLGISISAIGAERVLRGEIPYRDFWTMYAPGHFYLLALLFRVFGTHILVDTIAASVICSAASWVCYRLVYNLAKRRLAALACAAIFVAATLNTGYFKSVGSYPPAILFVLAGLNFMVSHYRTGKLRYLIAAGLATGAVVVFKHDVGGYTAIAILFGMVGHHFFIPAAAAQRVGFLLFKLTSYGVGVAAIVLPVAILFSILAGGDLLQNLVIFPLTDFRFARPEHYPGLFEFDIFGGSLLNALLKLFRYINFALPFMLFLLGLVATAVAVRKHNATYVAIGITFSAAYVLHYSAAHVQINTHIISMSIYGVFLGVLFYDLHGHEIGIRVPAVIKLASLFLIGGWFLSLIAEPVDKAWTNRRWLTTEMEFKKVSGLKVSPGLAKNYSDLLTFVDAHIAADESLFVGLHRHDIVIVGANAADYFILDRPIASRYHEIHPAVVDTSEVQREIIRDLQGKKVSLIILKRIKPDERLDTVKRIFAKNLPQIGATDLDGFIRENYVQVGEIGNNALWMRKDRMVPVAGSFELYRTNTFNETSTTASVGRRRRESLGR